MRVPLKTVIVIATTGLVAGSAATAGFITRGSVTQALVAQIDRHLAQVAVLAADRVRTSQEAAPAAIAEALARASGYRVSLVTADLMIVADSDFPARVGDPLTEWEDSREVTEAFRVLSASSVRSGPRDGREYVFHARRVYWRGDPVVLRFGSPTDTIHAQASASAIRVVVAVAGFGLAAMLLLVLAGGRVAATIRRQGDYLRQVAGGRRPSRDPGASGLTELAQVSAAASRIGRELESQIAGAHRERDELTQLMDQVAEGLIALTDDARVIRINPVATALLGLSDVAPFAPIGSIVREPHLRDLLEQSVIKDELRAEASVGGREVSVTTRRSVGGGSVVLLMDVTELRRLEAVRSDFVANASHELKTPLTVIRGAAETVLSEGLPDDLRRQFLISIERNTLRLQRLAEDLLDLSRYEAGVWRPAEAVVEVDKLARGVWAGLEARAAERGVVFRVVGGARAIGDEAAISQIFQNLFENALRYVPSGTGEIVVDVGADAEEVHVAVSDNGSGIPAAALPRIFERFYRVDAARSREEGGTGLGLAIVRHLVASMGGQVLADSTLGEGTTIRFTLPGSRQGTLHRSTAESAAPAADVTRP